MLQGSLILIVKKFVKSVPEEKISGFKRVINSTLNNNLFIYCENKILNRWKINIILNIKN